MRILSAAKIREADQYTIKNQPIASIDLMEKASVAFVDWFSQNFKNHQHINIFCGTGNNGGDGLAIGRLLIEVGYDVSAYVVRVSEGGSDDFKINFERLSKMIDIQGISEKSDLPEIKPENIIIEGLFGSGLSRLVEGFYAEVIDFINQQANKVVSIDIASGLFCDDVVQGDSIVKPDHTVSFQVPKLAFFLKENHSHVGNWTTVNIGLDHNFIEEQSTKFFVTEDKMVRSWYRKREKHSHKGNFGRALLISGAYGKMGAAVLAGRACMRSGVGLLTIHSPRCGYQILQNSVPEAMVFVDQDEDIFSSLPDLDNFTTIGIGPGIGTDDRTRRVFSELLQNWQHPMIVDADAINILAANREMIQILPENSIITPHIGEFGRLVGDHQNSMERLDAQQAFSDKHGQIIVLKGAYTSTSIPGGPIYFNNTGNPGMATGGSGDVLTGILTGLLAQGYAPDKAAIMGVYLHGKAGDIAATELSEQALIASDIIDCLSNVFKAIE